MAATQAELRAGLPDVATAADSLSRAPDERARQSQPRSGAPAAAAASDAAPTDHGGSSRTAGAAAGGAPAAARGRAAEPLRPDPDPNPAEHTPACVAGAGREELEVVFLGTGASIPSKYRNVTGIYLHRFAEARPVCQMADIANIWAHGTGLLGRTCAGCLGVARPHATEAVEHAWESRQIVKVVVAGAEEGAWGAGRPAAGLRGGHVRAAGAALRRGHGRGAGRPAPDLDQPHPRRPPCGAGAVRGSAQKTASMHKPLPLRKLTSRPGRFTCMPMCSSCPRSVVCGFSRSVSIGLGRICRDWVHVTC